MSYIICVIFCESVMLVCLETMKYDQWADLVYVLFFYIIHYFDMVYQESTISPVFE